MVLVTALRQGIDPTSTTYNSYPIDIKDPKYGPIKVKTYDGSYGGVMNLVRATLRSDNSVYIQLALDVGPENVRKTARLLGITSHLDGYPGEGLGGLKYGVSPLEMAGAYATLAAGGIRSRPIAIDKVDFPNGSVQQIGRQKRERVISDGVAREATDILEQNVLGGTGVKARIDCPAAGKTGTTDNFKDAWFVGFTPSMSSSVWVGYPNGGVEMRSVHGIAVAGGTFPAQIWHDYMVRAIGGHCKAWLKPLDPFSGKAFSGNYGKKGKLVAAPTEKTTDKKKKKKNNDKGDTQPTTPPDTNGGDPKPGDTPPPVGKPDDNTGAIEPRKL